VGVREFDKVVAKSYNVISFLLLCIFLCSLESLLYLTLLTFCLSLYLASQLTAGLCSSTDFSDLNSTYSIHYVVQLLLLA
jgi:hypothetical protein